jgi:hypothetical protein
MDLPDSTAANQKIAATLGGVSAIAAVGVPMLVKGEATGSASLGISGEKATEAVRDRHGLPQVVREIGASDFVVLLDDFHYMDRTVQTEVAKTLKEAVRLGIKVVTAAVSHRGDDVVRANPELRGRVRAIDLRYWTDDELRKIGDTGFGVLNADIPDSAITRFTKESAASPQLMQSLCLQACFALDLRQMALFKKPANIDDESLRTIFE